MTALMLVTEQSVAQPLPDKVLCQALSDLLPTETVTALLEYPAIAAELLPVFDELPFPADHIPREIEVLLDDVTVVVWRDGVIQQQVADVASDYQPALMEWVVDGETAYFSINGMTVIDRIQQLPLPDFKTLLTFSAMEEMTHDHSA